MSDISVGSSSPTDIARQMEEAERAAASALAEAQAQLKAMNDLGLKDDHGRTLHFDTLADWKKAWQENRGWQNASGKTLSIPELIPFRAAFDKAADKAIAAQDRLTTLTDVLMPTAMLKDLLDSGDIEGALMMLQTTRAKGLEAQLTARMNGMTARNEKIAELNKKIADWQAEPDGANKHKAEIATAQTDLGKLNNDSQLEMIQLQQIVNKRNEAYDMLSNLLGKFQKTMDGIIGNMR